MSNKIFVTGIGTDVGKTLLAAVLAEALQADYWKPIQSGDLQGKDSDVVKSLLTNTKSRIHPEYISLKAFMSPHAAADLEQVEIKLDKIIAPKTDNTLVIEGAGGLMVPINKRDLIIDLISALNASVVLVSRNYLGSINHTLLSYELLKQRGIKVLGIVFNGEENKSTEEFILNYTGYACIGRIMQESVITKDIISEYAKQIRPNLLNLIE